MFPGLLDGSNIIGGHCGHVGTCEIDPEVGLAQAAPRRFGKKKPLLFLCRPGAALGPNSSVFSTEMDVLDVFDEFQKKIAKSIKNSRS